jgi:hypothetical protein
MLQKLHNFRPMNNPSTNTELSLIRKNNNNNKCYKSNYHFLNIKFISVSLSSKVLCRTRGLVQEVCTCLPTLGP